MLTENAIAGTTRARGCGFAGNWLLGAAAGKSARRRLMAILRMSSLVLGMKRRRLGIGSLGFGGGVPVGASDEIATSPFALPATMTALAVVMGSAVLPDMAIANSVTLTEVCNGTYGTSTIGRDATGSVTLTEAVDGSGTYALVAGCGADGHNQLAPTVIGPLADVTGEAGTAVGFLAQAGKWATSTGLSANASGTGSVALGFGTIANNTNSVAIGGVAAASGALTVANSITASGAGAVAIGSNTTKGAQATGSDAIAIGGQSQASSDWAVAIGSGAVASGSTAVAIGDDAKATAIQATAMGSAALASGQSATALGVSAQATGLRSTALGVAASTAGDRGIAVGSSANASAADAVAMGTAAQASKGGAIAIGLNAASSGTNAIAIGKGAKATGSVALGADASAGNGGTALGDEAVATLAGGVALGKGSVEGATVASTGATIAGKAYTYAAGTSASSVSIGTAGAERQLQNVAAGRVSATSTDAINGSQLFATNQAIDAVSTVANKGFNVTTAKTGTGTVSGTSVANVAPGATQTVTAGNNIALVQSGSGLTIGTNPDLVATSLTTGNTKMDTNGVVITGGPSMTTAGVDAGSKVITNVATGVAGTDAVNVDQLTNTVATNKTKYYSVNDGGTKGGNYDNDGATGSKALAAGVGTVASGASAIALGDTATASKDGAIAIGKNSVSSGTNAIAIGKGAKATGSVALGADASAGNGGTALGDEAVATLAGGVALGKGSVEGATVASTGATIAGKAYTYAAGTSASSVSIGTAGAERQLQNVAAGRVSATSTDAINGSQLFATNQAIDAVSTVANKGFNVTTAKTGTGTVSGTSVANVAPGATQTVTAGNNIALVQNGTDLTIGTNPDLVATSLTTGNTKMDTNGVVITGGPSMTTAGVDAGSKVITNVATGVAGTDAVNVDQLTNTVATNKTKYYSVNSTGGGNEANDGATGTDAIASGKDALASASNSVALGAGANASVANSIALGSGATTAAAVGTAGATIAGTAYSFAGTAPTGTVSVGAVGAERTITNVAAGQVTAASTDAINGSQLFATNQAIDKVATTAGKGWNVSANGGTADNITPGEQVDFAALDANTSVTYDAATNKMVVGVVQAPNFTSVTTGNTKMDTNGVVITGGPSMTTAGVDAGSKVITNVATGVAGTDAVNVDQLTNTVATNKTKYYSVNSTGGGNEANDGATGTDAIASGKDALASASNSVALGAGANASVANSIALGSGATTAAAVGTAGATIAGTAYSFAGTAPTGTVSVGAVGAERTITNVAAGQVTAASTDAINGSQLFATNQAIDKVATTAGKGWNVSANGGTADNITPGEQVDFAALDANTSVTYDAATNKMVVGVVQAPNFTSVTTGNTKMDTNGVVITGGPSMTTAGVDAGSKVITNVATGVAGTDAVNVDQLTNTVATNKTKYYSVNSTGGGNEANDGATGTDAIASGKDALASASNSVALGAGANASVANSIALGSGATTAAAVGTAGATIAGTAYSFAGTAPTGTVSVGAVGAERTITNVAAGQVTAASTDAINGSQLFATNQAIDKVATTAGKGWNVSANGGTADNITPGEQVDFAALDANTSVTYDAATNKMVVGVVQAPNFTSVTTGNTKMDTNGVVITGGPSMTTAGVDAGSKVITNVATGVAGTDAVNVDQLTNTVATNKTKYYSVNSTGGGNEANDGATGTDAIASGKDALASASNSVALGAGANASVANSIALGSGATTAAAVGTAGATIAGTAYSFAGTAPTGTVSVGAVGAERTITNVAAGQVTAASTDAINGSQLFATNQAIDKVATTAGKGWNVSANGGTADNITPGEQVDFAALDANTSVTYDAATNKMVVGVVQAPNFTSVTTGNTKMDTNGVVITGGPSMTTAGVDAGSKVITNVATGVAGTDAVNVDQLTNTVATNKTKYYSVNSTGGGNEANDGATGTDAIASGKDALASASNSVALGAGANASVANSIALGSGATTAAAVGTAGATIAGTAYSFAGTAPTGTVSVGAVGAERTITNVAAGQVTAASTDAINGSQLFATNQAIDKVATTAGKGWNVSANGGTADNITPGEQVDFAALDANTSVTYDAATNKMVVGVVQAPNFTSVTTGNTKMDTNGVVITGGPSMTTAGVDAGSKVITNVATGVAGTDAVNVDQLTNTVATNKTKYYSVNDGGTKGGNYDNDGATGSKALAAGVGTVASGASAIALGDTATASKDGAIAIGKNSVSSGTNAIAIGKGAKATGSVALGADASAGNGGTALGDEAVATLAGGVALGKGSVEGATVASTGATIAGKAYTYAAGTSASSVSIGSAGNERQLQNVASGQMTATSTDAVNGSQLFATNQAIDAVSTVANKGFNVTTATTGTGTVSGTSVANVAPGATQTVTAGNNIALVQNGTDLTIGTNPDLVSTSLTTGNTKMDTNGVVITGGPSMTTAGVDAGSKVITNVATGVAGTDAVNVDQLTKVAQVADNAVQYDDATKTTVTLNPAGAASKITNLAAGDVSAGSTDAVNGSQLFATNTAVTQLGDAITNVAGDTSSTYTDANGMGIRYARTNEAGLAKSDAFAQGPGSTALGYEATAAAADSVAVGKGTKANNVGDVALGSGSTTSVAVGTTDVTIAGTTYAFAGTTPTSTVSVGAVGVERTITNVAAGRLTGTSTDAVNGSQLFATNQAVESVTKASGNTSQIAVKYDWDDKNGDGVVDPGEVNYNSVTMEGAGGTKITNVAPGTVDAASKDAINGSQLYGVSQSVANHLGGGSTVNPDGSVTGPTYVVQGGSYGTVYDAVSAIDKSITNVAGDVTNLTNNFNNGTIGLVQQTGGAPGSGQITVGKDTGGTSVNLAGTDGNRVLTGVAEGAVNATSKDAVNGSQLNATNTQVTQNTTDIANLDNRVTNVEGDVTNLTNNLQKGSIGLVQQTGGTSGGQITVAKDTGGTSVSFAGSDGDRVLSGVAAGIADTDAVNLGQLKQVAATAGKNKYFSTNSTGGGNENNDGATGADAVAIGKDAVASVANGYAAGSGAKATANAGDVALGAGSATATVVGTSGATINDKAYSFAGANPTSTVSVGDVGSERTVTNVAAGRVSTTSTDAVNGSQLFATNQAIDVVADDLESLESMAVTYDNSTRSSVTFNRGGKALAVSNIADGAVNATSKDAVNGSQLHAVQQGAKNYTDTQVANLRNDLTNQFSNVTSRLDGLDRDVRQLRRSANGGIATAIAMGSIPQAVNPGKGLFGIGTGYRNGEFGVALGFSGRFEDDRTTIKASLGYDSYEVSLGAGIGVEF
ncbi:hypothetical protein [Sphingomonas cavernae]|uniref:Head domain of trimeric autotransporter adhesin n=1 Tax=Sphingomonas cavernae TaxID=2320861 RepID=A0A418WJS0_9SPHN|nr:hypothetical protein [Sphingomonas cavernae]RJF90250.1 hypothetical protein D3876_08190 [Sphingomonas cavernae]